MVYLTLGAGGKSLLGNTRGKVSSRHSSKPNSFGNQNARRMKPRGCRRAQLLAPRAKNGRSVIEELSEKIFTSTIFYLSLGSAFSFAVVKLTADSSIAVLLLAALPIAGLTALSKSSTGDDLLQRAIQNREVMQAKLESIEEERNDARRSLKTFYGSTRTLLLRKAPKHLNGDLPGDQGFDPLGLAVTPGSMGRMREYELLHGRWAMLGVPGILAPEFLGRYSDLELGETVWWKVGASKLAGGDLDYLGIEGLHLAGGQAIVVIVAAQAILMGGPEYARFIGIRSLEPVGVALPGPDALYPGGAPFDPFNFATSFGSTFYETQKVSEIKHGRLAMISFVGMAAQAVVTEEGPIQNLVQITGRG